MPERQRVDEMAFASAVERARDAGDAALAEELGPAQLIGAPPDTDGEGAWSYQTRAMGHGAASLRLGVDLWRATIFPVRKTTRAFPGIILVGRAGSSDVLVDHPSISKLHARIRRLEDGTYTIQDAGSRNGTLVGGRPVGAQEVPLPFGAAVEIGHWPMRFERLSETLALLRSSS